MQTTSLATITHAVDMWRNESKLQEIRQLISSTPLNDTEFSYVVELGKATQLNPFMREIWVVKYSPKVAASIFIGRDGYRKAAQRHSDYEYHQVNAVYSKDEFKIMNDEIQHTYGFSNRGELIGAYCIVKRKNSSRPTYVMVTMAEYKIDQSLWKTKPETMIKKVAEAQALRQAFQEVLAGTYSDAEMPQERAKPLQIIEGNTQTERLKNLLKENDHQEEIFDTDTGTQLNRINLLIEEIQLPFERLEKALNHYGAISIEDLTGEQMQSFIANLEKEKLRNQG